MNPRESSKWAAAARWSLESFDDSVYRITAIFASCVEPMHIPYQQRTNRLPDFLVKYKIYLDEETGRKTLPYQAIRWDFWYPHEAHRKNQIFMIWPEFLNEDGSVMLEDKTPVPISGIANMWIVNSELADYHARKIKVGSKGFFHEGPRRVGECEVIKLIGLRSA